jgi:hypothetical protein
MLATAFFAVSGGIWQVSFALFGTWWLFRDVATIGGRAEPVDSPPFHQRRLGG